MTPEICIPESFTKAPPADLSTIAKFEAQSGLELPEAYKSFIVESNGGEGFVGDNGYAILWPVEELAQLNRAYQADQYEKGLLLIGSDGGGEALAFDLRVENRPVVALPFVGMSLDLVEPVAASFGDFFGNSPEGGQAGPHFDSQLGEAKGVTAGSEAPVEIFEIHPVILGGDPTDPANKTILTRAQHIEAVRYWNQVIDKTRAERRSG